MYGCTSIEAKSRVVTDLIQASYISADITGRRTSSLRTPSALRGPSSATAGEMDLAESCVVQGSKVALTLVRTDNVLFQFVIQSDSLRPGNSVKRSLRRRTVTTSFGGETSSVLVTLVFSLLSLSIKICQNRL